MKRMQCKAHIWQATKKRHNHPVQTIELEEKKYEIFYNNKSKRKTPFNIRVNSHQVLTIEYICHFNP